MSRVEPSPVKVLSTRRAPREGTQLRVVYDLLQANKGQPVDIDTKNRNYLNHQIDQLKSFYGLDIRSMPEAKRKGVRYNHILVGEYVGKDYVNYLDVARA